jgi:hypothetical protein
VKAPQDVALARMPGSSIAAPGAMPWVTDFLNAAFGARPREERDPADLRLAFGVLTTRWAQRGRRLGARDLPAFHRAFGGLRLEGSGGRTGTLDHDALLEGGARLLGDWFPAAWADDRRRAHGIAFPTVAARRGFDPGDRLVHAALGDLTPPRAPEDRRHRHIYAPVALPDPEGAVALLRAPARWPDFGSASGRFTALRRGGGLRGQTFEIEVAAEPVPRLPVFQRAYVTCTGLATGERAARRVRALAEALGEPVVGEDAQVLALVELTTHRGHVLGRAVSRLVVWRDGRGGWVRDVGEWDPLPPVTAAAYAAAGREAQAAFWGPEDPERSMLVQLAATSAR